MFSGKNTLHPGDYVTLSTQYLFVFLSNPIGPSDELIRLNSFGYDAVLQPV